MCMYVRNKETSDTHFIFVRYSREQLHQTKGKNSLTEMCAPVSAGQFTGILSFPTGLILVAQYCHYLTIHSELGSS